MGNPGRTYLYVDGENHYRRTQAAFQTEHEVADLKDLNAQWACPETGSMTKVFVDDPGRVFWTPYFLVHFRSGFHPDHYVRRAMYFTTIVGQNDKQYPLELYIRQFGFDPFVIQELKDLATKRGNIFRDRAIIESPKGVDVALAVRMVEDAYLDHYDEAILFSSDVDFLPAIYAVRRRGKRVVVAAYEDGLSEHYSPLRTVPDDFWNLSEWVKKCQKPAQTPQA